jgi:hypothetical protein
MCAGCTKAALERAKAMSDAKSEAIPPVPVPAARLSMNCPGCGLTRLLPTGLNVNDIFELVPCPKCANAFRGQFVGNGVQETI